MPLTPSQVLFPEKSGDDQLIADLDWATGVVRMHMSMDEWRTIMSIDEHQLDDRSRYVREVLTHEGLHLLHLVTTGFAYELSVRLLRKVAEAVENEAGLEGVYNARARYMAELEVDMLKLHQRGPDGVSALDILESTAFLVQKRAHLPGLGQNGFEQMLNEEAPTEVYRRAYDIAVDTLGADAFDHLPHVATLALATREPTAVFVPILEVFHSEGSRLGYKRTHEAVLEMLRRRFGTLLLGHALERLQEGHRHPILNPIMLGYNQLAMTGKLQPLTMMARPHAMDQDLANLLFGPMIFQPRREGEPAPIWAPQVWVDRVGSDAKTLLGDLKFLCAVSNLIVMDIEPAPHEIPQERDVRTVYDMPAMARSWEITAENRTDVVADNLANRLAEIERDSPAKIRIMRSTVAITFPDDEHPGSPYLDPEVRRFVRGLYERIPHLLYFLAADIDWAGGAFVGCAAAHSPDEGVTEGPDGSVLVAVGYEMILGLMACFQAATIFAHRMGDDPQFLLAHLRDTGPTVRQALTAVVLDPDLASTNRDLRPRER